MEPHWKPCAIISKRPNNRLEAAFSDPLAVSLALSAQPKRLGDIRMRAMKVIAASERLTKLEFEADIDWETYPRSEYTCFRCGEKISFTLRNLDKHAHSTFTNLSPADASAIERIVAGRVGDANSFVDFYCPGCKLPVRIYYQSWGGGRFTHGYIFRFVVEGIAR